MSLLRIAAAALALGAASPVLAQPVAEPQTSEEAAAAALARFTSPTLTRFADDSEFEAYLAALRTRRDLSARREDPIRFAMAQPDGEVQQDVPEEPVCPPEDPTCRGDEGAQYITVTGSRIAPSNASITNNQMRGVEEGDIVKQIGRFLLILSDGRIFVVDTRPGGSRGLALADRVNVYRESDADTWYDEMLVFGDRILITGYSYDEEATELSVFRLSPEGRLSAEGVFMLSSNDYYDTGNYATRMIGDNLVIHTPLDLSESSARNFKFPLVRRWLPEEDHEAAEARGRRLFDARSIHRPVRLEEDPTVHTVSVCPLGPVGRERDFDCRSTAFVGPADAQWYVTADEAILWALTWNDYGEEDCESGAPPLDAVIGAVLFRVPHDGSAPSVLGARGVPFDQFSLQANDGRLRALVDRYPEACQRRWQESVEPIYVDIPLAEFSPLFSEISHARYVEVPNPGTRWIANRFTETDLVYGGLSQYRRGPPAIDWSDYENDPERLAERRRSLAMPPAFVVPAARPRDVRSLDIGHSVIRAERFGARDIVLTGYRDRRGLSMSMIDLDGRPRIASTLRLPDRFESEGRSHAFNSIVEGDGSGIIGLPTSPKREDGARWWWRSRASDLSFVSADRTGRLADIGMLESRIVYDRRHGDEEDGLADYECEVSCIDWYGNSRPIFTDGRIFALTGVELIEGRVEEGGIVELRRFDFARARPRRR